VFSKSDAKVIGMIRDISKKDPDAVVILLGDHGAYLNRDCWLGVLDDLNENMRMNGFFPRRHYA